MASHLHQVARAALTLCLVLCACEGSIADFPDSGSSSSDAGPVDSGAVVDAGELDAGNTIDAGRDAGSVDSGVDAGATDAGPVDAGPRDAGAPDAGPRDAGTCATSALCEWFDRYDAGTLQANSNLGPWSVRVENGMGHVSIDTAHAYSGNNALKVHIDQGASSGGQLRTRAAPVFSTPRPQVYGRFMMYLAQDAGTSVHWTMFGAAGTVPSGGPTAGHHATYLFSAFNEAGRNRFGEVYYDDQTAQDCWHHSTQLMPMNQWACVSFAVDGVATTYRMSLNGQAVPSLSLNTTGDGCLNAAGNTPWYGPRFDEFYLGALSFHPMSAPLDLWVDDVVLDTSPVGCP